jgi:hypothetical protein
MNIGIVKVKVKKKEGKMKKIMFVLAVLFISTVVFSFAQEGNLLLDDFEITVTGGTDGTVDFGSGNDSTLEVSSESDIKYSSDHSLRVVYNAATGGYMWIARGFDLDAHNAGWLVGPQDINWAEYSAIAFYMYGSDSKARVAFDIKDNGNEIWRFIVIDDFSGWKQIACPFDQFMVRDDWQPDSSDRNVTIDFPIKSYQFEPLPESSGTLYFDKVELIKK